MGNDNKNNLPKVENPKPQEKPQGADPELVSYIEKGFTPEKKDSGGSDVKSPKIQTKFKDK